MDTNTIDLKKELIARGFKSMMEDAQVPMRQHLAVVQALQKKMQEHSQDVESYQAVLKDYESLLKKHETQQQIRESQIQSHVGRIEELNNFSQELLANPPVDGIDGKDGKDGKKGKDGRDAKDIDEEAIVSRIMAAVPGMLPEPVAGKDAELDEDALVETILTRLKTGKELDLTHIKGAQRFIKDGVSYKFEELMHGAGKTTSGSGLNYLALQSGAINNTNTTFTFASTPTIVVVNGASYINGSGVTISGITATLDNPPGNSGSVYALG